MEKNLFAIKMNQIGLILNLKKDECPDMLGMDWAYEHNWISEQEMNNAREKELILNIWRDFAFILISDFKQKNEADFMCFFDNLIFELKELKKKTIESNEGEYLERNINNLLIYKSNFISIDEIAIFNFVNSFVEAYKILKK
jgi:hypothetical protein